jgi:hypothetical protein
MQRARRWLSDVTPQQCRAAQTSMLKRMTELGDSNGWSLPIKQMDLIEFDFESLELLFETRFFDKNAGNRRDSSLRVF